eukprot:GHVL01031666.1.p1 GENE.GHVL01031666.1~~GHVL01031666.1.p1  ORF type:complete len:450 (+),score=99.94 GHVL01031666.1:725-2074(+)
MPIFALGRAQELLLILEEYWESKPHIQHIPIFYLTPMATACLPVYQTYLSMCGASVREVADRGNDAFSFSYVTTLDGFTNQQVLQIVDQAGPCVVMAAPAMLQSGLSRDLFEIWAEDSCNTTIITGYSVRNTLANDLVNSSTRTFQKSDGTGEFTVAGDVHNISFSAHADFHQTTAFVGQLTVQNVVLVHGEKNKMLELADKLRESLGVLVHTPATCQTMHIDMSKVLNETSVSIVGELANDILKIKKNDKSDDISETAKSETAKDETAKGETAKNETAKGETAKDETAKNEAAKSETAKGETTKGETAKSETAKVECAWVGDEFENVAMRPEDLLEFTNFNQITFESKQKLNFPFSLIMLKTIIINLFNEESVKTENNNIVLIGKNNTEYCRLQLTDGELIVSWSETVPGAFHASQSIILSTLKLIENPSIYEVRTNNKYQVCYLTYD